VVRAGRQGCPGSSCNRLNDESGGAASRGRCTAWIRLSTDNNLTHSLGKSYGPEGFPEPAPPAFLSRYQKPCEQSNVEYPPFGSRPDRQGSRSGRDDSLQKFVEDLQSPSPEPDLSLFDKDIARELEHIVGDKSRPRQCTSCASRCGGLD
jgi:hypothetical protein